ncbi:MAG: DegV family protein [Anaerolineales bacterium]|nr:DegV family protein [Anaerolineales bacterium]
MIRLVTDSASNVPEDIRSRYNIEVVPLKVIFGSESYREGNEISVDEFLRRLPHADPMPTTSQPSPLEFEETFRAIVDAGDEVLCLVLSSKLSGTYNSARNAMIALEGAPISLVDTLSISAGASMMLKAAGDMIEAGLDREQIATRLQPLTEECELVLTLDTLEYLKRGGRIGGAQAFIGGLLKVKPTIILKDGVLEAGERARSRKKALGYIVERHANHFGDQPVWVGIAQAAADDSSELEALLRQRLNVQTLIRSEIGPVILTHTGPAVVGAAVIPAPDI